MDRGIKVQNRTVSPFRGKLQTLVGRKYAELRPIDEEGNVERRRTKELDYLFSSYSQLVSLDDFFMSILMKKSRFENYTIGLVERFDRVTKYLRVRFVDNMSTSFLNDVRKMRPRLEQLETQLKELAEKNIPIQEKLKLLRKEVQSPRIKKELIPMMADLVADAFNLMGIPVAIRAKRNAALNIEYTQFGLASKLEMAMAKTSKTESEKMGVLKRAGEIQVLALETKLAEQGYFVQRVQDFFSGARSEAVIAYDPEIKDFPMPINPGEDASEIEKRHYQGEMEAFREVQEMFVKEVYSPMLIGEGTNEYQKFESISEYKEALKAHKMKQKVLDSKFPLVEERQVQIGTSTKTKKDGTVVEEPIYDYVHDVTFMGEGDTKYTLHRYDLQKETPHGEEKTVQVTDGEGESALATTRVVKTRKIFVGDHEMDIIVEGRYKGLLLEDMVNISGKLIEGSFYTKSPSGKLERIQLLQDSYVELASEDENTPPTIVQQGKEFSFLNVTMTEKGAKVLRNRLTEPYISLSADKTRLILGIPNGNANTQDRKAIKRLAEVLPGLEQKKDPRLSASVNGLNPFYYLDAPSFEPVRNTLGSVAISKPAMDFLERYYQELTARDRAINEENLKNFTSESLGGFVEVAPNGKPFQFNNKQREAMAWLDANGYSGLMALDTGVGKTLLAGGAMRRFMNTEKEGDTRQFLFIAPKRLKGNFTSEMLMFMKDKNIVASRIREMDYNEYSALVRGMDSHKEILKLSDDDKKKIALKKVLPVNFFTDETKTKAAFADAAEYFKDKFSILFFDEINEILKNALKRKAVSELKHPRKIILTASAIEKDPIDLYRFVAIAKGEPASVEKERAFAERYGNMIGGRFVGLKDAPEVRSEFDTWVKANAYFADKQEVDFAEIGQPDLPLPLEPITIKIGMSEQVEAEYRKLASKISKELKAMVRKYRDVLAMKGDYSDSEFLEQVRGKKQAIRDFTMGSIVALNDLIKLSTNPGDYFNDPDMPNPKLEEASNILLNNPGDRICYFSSDPKVVKSLAIKNSQTTGAGVHVAMLDNEMLFYVAGEQIGKISKKSKSSDISRIKELLSSTALPENLLRKVRDPEAFLQRFKQASEEIEEDPNAWAIEAVKSVIKPSPSIVSLCCTDNYAKGFSFQFINTVVHLDRGKGFDSELVKQRTARAYRTGQKEKVAVIYLDSVLTPSTAEITPKGTSKSVKDYQDVSLDEMKAIIQQVDQDFFTDIISKGMQKQLVESYESVTRVTGRALAVNKSLFTAALNPSAATLAEVAARDTFERENPATIAQLNPDRFLLNPLLSAQVGDSEALRSVADLAGVSSFTGYQFQTENDSLVVEDNTLLSDGVHFSQSTQIQKNDDGSLSIVNEEITIKRGAPKDTGIRLVLSQVVSALRNGNVKEIVCKATSQDAYYLWPMFGFNAVVSLPFLSSDYPLEPLSVESQIKDFLVANNKVFDGNKTCILDLYACIDKEQNLIGQDWWKANGSPLQNAKINLSPNSSSMRVLNEYLNKKCLEYGVSPEAFLSTDTDPFDLENPSAWGNVMSNGGLHFNSKFIPSIEIAKAYNKAFTQAFYSSPILRRITPYIIIRELDLKPDGIEPPKTRNASVSISNRVDPVVHSTWVNQSKKARLKSLVIENLSELGDFISADIVEATL